MMKKTVKTLKEGFQDNDKRMTLRQIAEVTGASYRAVADYAQKAGWTENGKRTLLNEEQVTFILEAMRLANNNQYDIPKRLDGTAVKLMTTAEIAGALGVSADKIKRSAKELFPSRIENGKATYWTEAEATAIKYNLRKNAQVMQAPKTRLEKELIIRQAMVLQQEIINDLEKENAGLKKELTGTLLLLDARTEGLQMIQRIAEASGLVMSDRDDTEATYRRR
jgi:hypothetical protein